MNTIGPIRINLEAAPAQVGSRSAPTVLSECDSPCRACFPRVVGWRKCAWQRLWQARVGQVARATWAMRCSAGLMQTAEKRPRLFERSEFLGRPPCMLPALDRLACGIGHLFHPGRV